MKKFIRFSTLSCKFHLLDQFGDSYIAWTENSYTEDRDDEQAKLKCVAGSYY